MIKPRSRFSRILRKLLLLAAVILIVLGAWVAFDLTRAHQTDIRRFDPDRVAQLETAMWRSYYSRERVKLFRQLGQLLREQYGFPYWRSQTVAFRAARAAFVFKDGRQRSDYERALPDLVEFYGDIRSVSNTDFNVERAARLELEWWIVHRERARHAPGDLERALAESAAEVYRVPAERLAAHAAARAEAMKIRDTQAAAGGVTEADWARIDALLRDSWRALHAAVNGEAVSD